MMYKSLFSLLKKIKEKKVIFTLIVICIIYFILKLTTYLNGLVFFDEGIYIGIAKYFASAGRAGYFESIRPLALSVLLIPFQWLPFNKLITGRFFGLILVIICIPAIYYITKKHFGQRCGLWSAFLFSTSNSIIIFGGYILTDVPSYVLALFGTSLILSKCYILGGAIVGLGFLFRFPVLMIIAPLVGYIIFKERKKFILPCIKFGLGIAITSLPYFIFNIIHYKGPVLQRLIAPLVEASALIGSQIEVYHDPILILYLKQVLITEPILLFLTIFAIIYYFKAYKSKIVLFLICISMFFLYFSFKVPHYEARYIIPIIPFLTVLAGVGAAGLVKKNKKYTPYLIILILLSGLIGTVAFAIKTPIRHDYSLQTLIEDYEARDLITDTAFPLLYSKSKVRLMRGPNLGNTYLTYREANNSQWFILDPEGYTCQPNDKLCVLGLNNKLGKILSKNNILKCGYLHGTKIIILTKKQAKITKSECLRSINYSGVPLHPPKTQVFIRLNGAGFTLEGELLYSTRLLELIKSIEENKIPAVVVLSATKISPNKDALNLIKNISPEIELGVLPTQGIETEIFIQNIYYLTNKNITVIVPRDDEWKGKKISIPNGIKYHIIGAWDKTFLHIPSKEIDLYTIKNWKTEEFHEYNTLKEKYDILLDCEDEIGIDIPVYMLTQKNYEIVKHLIDYIGQTQEYR